jgi:pyruvate/2-oxoglutarate dehydrogenase complex dihydrolipoamide acyltransferase (E2) component
MALIDIKVPDIGDFDEVVIIELMVKPGDTVKAEQSLITVESDKAAMETLSSWCWRQQALALPLHP